MATTETRLSTTVAQLTDTVLMISPDRFGFNDQTAATNIFQKTLSGTGQTIREKAMAEFSGVIDRLRTNGIQVAICPSRMDVDTPDAVFPNNWISFHGELDNIKAVLYPMLAPNRRAERQFYAVKRSLPWISFDPAQVLDLTHHEDSGQFLEGTGSMVLARREKVVFAHESARTSYPVLDEFCDQTGYRPVKFHAYGKGGKPIYHTNVVMAVGERFSVVCLEAITNARERNAVEDMLKELRREIIAISLDQLYSYCGNVLEVQPNLGRSKIIMSTTAFDAFTPEQREQLTDHGDLLPVIISTIETIGGGSARCMLTEVFPSK